MSRYKFCPLRFTIRADAGLKLLEWRGTTINTANRGGDIVYELLHILAAQGQLSLHAK